MSTDEHTDAQLAEWTNAFPQKTHRPAAGFRKKATKARRSSNRGRELENESMRKRLLAIYSRKPSQEFRQDAHKLVNSDYHRLHSVKKQDVRVQQRAQVEVENKVKVDRLQNIYEREHVESLEDRMKAHYNVINHTGELRARRCQQTIKENRTLSERLSAIVAETKNLPVWDEHVEKSTYMASQLQSLSRPESSWDNVRPAGSASRPASRPASPNGGRPRKVWGQPASAAAVGKDAECCSECSCDHSSDDERVDPDPGEGNIERPYPGGSVALEAFLNSSMPLSPEQLASLLRGERPGGGSRTGSRARTTSSLKARAPPSRPTSARLPSGRSQQTRRVAPRSRPSSASFARPPRPSRPASARKASRIDRSPRKQARPSTARTRPKKKPEHLERASFPSSGATTPSLYAPTFSTIPLGLMAPDNEEYVVGHDRAQHNENTIGVGVGDLPDGPLEDRFLLAPFYPKK